MKASILLGLIFSNVSFFAQSLNFNISTNNNVPFTLNCYNPTLLLMANSNFPAPIIYTWSSGTLSATGSSLTVNSPGIYSITASAPSVSASQTLAITLNTTVPVSSASSTFQVISATASPQVFTFTAVSPSINIGHYVYPPTGGTVTGTATTFIYSAAGAGVYMHCIMDYVNGCASCQPFELSVSAPGEFTGLEKNRTNENLVFPNPNKGIFNLNFKEAIGHIELYNSLGTLIYVDDIKETSVSLDISQEASGVYFLKIKSNDGNIRNHRIIKD